ncbi:MAG: hypothetical protein IJG16_09280 [Clostridia bacterium]|nr:hypothetical protein [Clostridia bacterium]
MDIKRLFLIPAILLLFFVAAKAEAATPYYTVRNGEYNETNGTYTVEVYLTTDDYLATGTFGMEFDNSISPIWHDGSAEGENVGYLQLDREYFVPVEPAPMREAEGELSNKNYIISVWGLNETDASNPVRGELHLGTVTIENVTLNSEGYPEGWTENTFRLLDWNDTIFVNQDLFGYKDEDGERNSINEEIWRDISDEEKTSLGTKAPVGYYQGIIADEEGNTRQTDIDFKYISGILPSEMSIVGQVQTYNPKNDIRIMAYKDGLETDVYEAEITGYAIRADGEITYTYSIDIPSGGAYTLICDKSIHLPYIKNIEVEETDAVTDAPFVKMICGDINGDGYVKLPDRACFIRFLNRQSPSSVYPNAFDAADLNGDGNVNLFDLSILKLNMNKTY